MTQQPTLARRLGLGDAVVATLPWESVFAGAAVFVVGVVVRVVRQRLVAG